MIRDRHAVRVAREVLQQMLGSAKRRFRVDDPVMAKERSEVRAERRRIGEGGQAAGPRDHPASKRAFEAGDTLSAKHPAQHLDWQKKAEPRVHPARAIRREPADRDLTVHVRMVQQVLAPRVEYAEKSKRCAEMSRVSGDFEQRRRARAKE